jgi:hypothetical protein
MLALCFVIQLFGADWFNVSTQNETFIKVCNFIEDRLWLKQICVCIICLILGTFTILAILRQKFYNKLQIFVFIPLLILLSYSSWYLPFLNTVLSFIVYLVPIFWLKRKWYRAPIGILLINIFQILSIFIKNIGNFYLNNTSFLVSTILQIDSLIMVILYYLYSIRKEN